MKRQTVDTSSVASSGGDTATLYSTTSGAAFPTRYTDEVNAELSKMHDWDVLSTHNIEPETEKIPNPEDRAASPILPTEHSAGFAPEALLRRGLQVPTRSKLITSGFSYPDVLSSYSVTEDAWNIFTSQITAKAQMTASQWHTTIGKGLGTLAVGGLILGWFGAVPAFIILRKAKQNREEENLRKSMVEEGELASVIAYWNQHFFTQRGLLIRVDLPNEADDMGAMDVAEEPKIGCRRRSNTPPTSSSSSSARRSAKEAKARIRAARKGRIVILPLTEEPGPAAEMLRGKQVEAATPKFNLESFLYEQKTGLKDYYPDEPKP